MVHGYPVTDIMAITTIKLTDESGYQGLFNGTTSRYLTVYFKSIYNTIVSDVNTRLPNVMLFALTFDQITQIVLQWSFSILLFCRSILLYHNA